MAEQDRDTLLMLGEMRSDIKYLVAASHDNSERHRRLEARVAVLENFKITIGVFTAALAVGAPMLMSALLRKLGII